MLWWVFSNIKIENVYDLWKHYPEGKEISSEDKLIDTDRLGNIKIYTDLNYKS